MTMQPERPKTTEPPAAAGGDDAEAAGNAHQVASSFWPSPASVHISSTETHVDSSMGQLPSAAPKARSSIGPAPEKLVVRSTTLRAAKREQGNSNFAREERLARH
jgi:hypothetical protein